MNVQHKELAAGRWQTLSLVEQMANIGSEVERALHWRAAKNIDYSDQALARALELIDLTLNDPKNKSRLREILLARESLVDFFTNGNQYQSTEESLKNYFLEFAYAARRNR